MMTRRGLFIVLLVLLPVAAIPSCSETVRYRVLSFLLDGVPDPGARAMVDTTGHVGTSLPGSSGASAETVAAAWGVYAHAPYRDNQCGGCHAAESGEPFKSVEEGLCQACHLDIPGEALFVHGPVAVNACLFCHDHHTAPFPKLLVNDPATLCYRCHHLEDLTAGEHHAGIGSGQMPVCLECHNPHGGHNRFFVRRPDS